MKGKILIGLFLLILVGVGNAPAQSEKTVSYGILLDNAGSMTPMLGNVKNIGKEIVAQTHQKGAVSLYGFAKRSSVAEFKTLMSSSQDQKKLEEKIDALQIAIGQTLLFEVIEHAGKTMIVKGDKDAQKILILITDGSDRGSSVTETQIINNLKAGHVKVHTIGFVRHLPTEPQMTKTRSAQEEAKAFLIKIAKETGGRAVFPKEGDNIREIIKNLLAD